MGKAEPRPPPADPYPNFPIHSRWGTAVSRQCFVNRQYFRWNRDLFRRHNGRLVKIIQLHDSARSVMMDGLDEANQLGAAAWTILPISAMTELTAVTLFALNIGITLLLAPP